MALMNETLLHFEEKEKRRKLGTNFKYQTGLPLVISVTYRLIGSRSYNFFLLINAKFLIEFVSFVLRDNGCVWMCVIRTLQLLI